MRADRQFWGESAAYSLYSRPLPLSYACQWLDFVQHHPVVAWQTLIATCSRRYDWDENFVSCLTINDGQQLGGILPSQENVNFFEKEWLRMCNLLVGRSLSIEELYRLLADCDCPNALRDWRFYVQIGYLRQRIQFQPGIRAQIEPQNKWFSFRKKDVVRQCTRCGASWSDHAHLHARSRSPLTKRRFNKHGG
jgi:hypothetical protein